jgi:hypothetical protein
MKNSEKQRQSDKKFLIMKAWLNSVDPQKVKEAKRYFKDVFYSLSIATEKEILTAEKIQNTLYSKYDKVTITPIGMCKIQIHATNK